MNAPGLFASFCFQIRQIVTVRRQVARDKAGLKFKVDRLMIYSMKMIPLATFNEAGPAEALKERFQHAGIRAIHRDESKLQRFGFMTRPAATQKVVVDMDDFEKASQLLEEWDKTDHVLDQAVRCPQCRSARVEYPQFTRKFVTPIVVELFVSFGLFPKNITAPTASTWPKDAKPEPERHLRLA
jgi:hypothetical protein